MPAPDKASVSGCQPQHRGILIGSLTAAVLASVLLRIRNRTYRLVCEYEDTDTDQDGIPDIYQNRSGPAAPERTAVRPEGATT